MKFLLCYCLNAIAIFAILPLAAQDLPKFCGTEFIFQSKPYCVRTLASSNDDVIIEVVTTQVKILEEEINGLEYRQYQLLSTCENAQSTSKDDLFLIQLRYLSENGKVIIPNAISEKRKPFNDDSDLALTAYQMSCDSRNESINEKL